MSAAKRAASLLPQLTRGFRSSAAAKAGKDITHEHIAYGAPHHGNPPGYTYDWQHGPHSLRPDLIPNFTKKWNIVMPLMFAVATAAPALIVTYQQWKLKA